MHQYNEISIDQYTSKILHKIIENRQFNYVQFILWPSQGQKIENYHYHHYYYKNIFIP